jgi:hypothetical protein
MTREEIAEEADLHADFERVIAIGSVQSADHPGELADRPRQQDTRADPMPHLAEDPAGSIRPSFMGIEQDDIHLKAALGFTFSDQPHHTEGIEEGFELGDATDHDWIALAGRIPLSQGSWQGEPNNTVCLEYPFPLPSRGLGIVAMLEAVGKGVKSFVDS